MTSVEPVRDATEECKPRDGWADRRIAISRRIEVIVLELLVDRGVSNVTVEDIIAAANISRSTFYRYFEAVDDVMCEMPRRSLERLTERFIARPISEPIFTAYLNAARDIRHPDDEKRIQDLGISIYNKEPELWWKAIARMRPSSREAHKAMVFRRLQLCGQETYGAQYIGAVLDAVMDEVAQATWSIGKPESAAEVLESAMTAAIAGLER